MGGVSRPEGQRPFFLGRAVLVRGCSVCWAGLWQPEQRRWQQWLVLFEWQQRPVERELEHPRPAIWNYILRCTAAAKTAAGGICRPILRGKLTTKTQGLVGNERP